MVESTIVYSIFAWDNFYNNHFHIFTNTHKNLVKTMTGKHERYSSEFIYNKTRVLYSR